MHPLRRVNQETGQLTLNNLCIRQKRKFLRIVVPVLGLQNPEIDRAGIQPGRSAGLHPPGLEADRSQTLGDAERSGIARPAAGRVGVAAVHHAAQKGSGGKHDGTRGEFHPHARFYAPYAAFPLLHDEEYLRGLILPNIEPLRVFQHVPPLLAEARLVALGAGAPHSGPLRAVEHAELNGRTVGDDTCHTAQRVDLPHDLPLRHPADGGIAGHVCQLGHIHREQQRPRPHPGRRRGRLAAGVSAAYDDNIVIELHTHSRLAFSISLSPSTKGTSATDSSVSSESTLRTPAPGRVGCSSQNFRYLSSLRCIWAFARGVLSF